METYNNKMWYETNLRNFEVALYFNTLEESVFGT